MRAPADRSHLSIGEVLSLLQDEFPDVTISKIRFLESQGLLDPERTPSGYRKFYETDIERLRWILRQQKDHYLPLKVIKDRLDDVGPGDEPAGPAGGDRGDWGGGPVAEPGVGPSERRARGAGAPPAMAPPPLPLDDRLTAPGAGPVDRRASAPDDRPWRGPDDRGTLGPGQGQWPGPEDRATDQRPRPAADRATTAGADELGAWSGADDLSGTGLGDRATTGAGDRAAAPDDVRWAGGAGRRGSAPGERGEGVAAGDWAAADDRRPGAAAPRAGPGSDQTHRPGGADALGRPANGTVHGSPRHQPLPPSPALAPSPAQAPTASPAPSAPGRSPSAPLGGPSRGDTGFEPPSGSVSLTIDELAEASGVGVRDLHDLERFGLLEGHQVGDDTYYDGDALVVARTAGGFLQHGIEARHLRSYKVAVDREAGLFEQIVLPLLKQRNPEAHRRAARTVAELVHLGEVLRGVLLRRELRDHVGP